jgi:hypothetical protein
LISLKKNKKIRFSKWCKQGGLALLLTGKQPHRNPFLGLSVLGDHGVGKTTLLRLLEARSARIVQKGEIFCWDIFFERFFILNENRVDVSSCG